MFTLGVFTLGVLVGCSGDADGGDADGGDADGGWPPDEFPEDTSRAGVEAFLARGAYAKAPWVFDAEIRPASDLVSPHGPVRAYFNPTAFDSLAAGHGDETPHAAGSMVVKESYDEQGNLLGRSVSMKTGADGSPSSWLYYCDAPRELCGNEATAPSPFYSTGPTTSCQACHGGEFFAPLP